MRALLALVAILLLGAQVAATELHAIAGIPVTLALPDGFFPLPDQSILRTADSSALVIGAQLTDTLFLSTTRAGTSGVPAIAGLPPNLPVEAVVAGGRSFYLISGSREFAGRPSHIWVAITGPTPSVILDFVQSDGAQRPTFDREAVLAALGSVELEAPVTFEQHTRDLGIAITPMAPFVGSDFQTSDSASLSVPSQDPGAPVLLIRLVRSGSETASLGAVSDASLMPMALTALEVAGTQPWPFEGQTGLKRTGTGKGPDGRAVAFVQYVSLVAGGAVSLTASGTADQLMPLMSTIDAMVASFNLRPSSSLEPPK